MKVLIQYQDLWGTWRPYQTKHNERDLRTASNRARSTGKRHRLVDENGNLLDLVTRRTKSLGNLLLSAVLAIEVDSMPEGKSQSALVCARIPPTVATPTAIENLE